MLSRRPRRTTPMTDPNRRDSAGHLGLRLPTVLVVFSLLVAACGGGGDATGSSASPSTQAEPETEAPAPTESDSGAAAEEQVISVGLATVFGGFRWNVVEARLGESFGTPTVSVSIDVENLGPEEDSAGVEVSLETPNGVIANTGFGVTTDIAAGSSESGIFEFQVAQGLAIEDSTLLIGRDGEAQASVPLGGGDVVSLEPIEIAVDEVDTADAIEIRLAKVVVDWHSLAVLGGSAEKGTSFLTTIVDITLGDQSRTAKDTFELVLPNGDIVVPERAPNEVLDAGEPAEGLEVAFIVPDPTAGDYLLRLLNLSRFPEDALAEVLFTIGE